MTPISLKGTSHDLHYRKNTWSGDHRRCRGAAAHRPEMDVDRHRRDMRLLHRRARIRANVRLESWDGLVLRRVSDVLDADPLCLGNGRIDRLPCFGVLPLENARPRRGKCRAPRRAAPDFLSARVDFDLRG